MSGLTVTIPGRAELELSNLLLDVNGTLTSSGDLVPGAAARIRGLARTLTIHLLSADTFGTAAAVASDLGVGFTRVQDGREKLLQLERLGPTTCAAVGNGANDRLMLHTAALGIGVVGPEGGAAVTLTAADIVCRSIIEALDLLSDPRLIAATLRP